MLSHLLLWFRNHNVFVGYAFSILDQMQCYHGFAGVSSIQDNQVSKGQFCKSAQIELNLDGVSSLFLLLYCLCSRRYELVCQFSSNQAELTFHGIYTCYRCWIVISPLFEVNIHPILFLHAITVAMAIHLKPSWIDMLLVFIQT